MEDTGSRADRIRRRPPRLIVERGFEMERVEQKLLATAYENLWSPGCGARDWLQAARCVGHDLVPGGRRQEAARRIGRGVGSGSLLAMGG